MIDLSFFYSAKMAVVFILMLSSATLEAQRNENDKFFNLMTAIGEDFGGEFNDTENVLELDLNGVNLFLERLHKFAAREIIRKNENGEFECKKSKKSDFQMAIKTIFDDKSFKKVHNLLTIFDDKSFKKVHNLLKVFSEFSDAQLFNLLFSLAARQEALVVHGKNSDGTLKEKEENSQDKIQTFLAVPKCFQESELSIFDYWIEIIKMKSNNRRKTIFRVAIYKEKYDEYKSEDRKEKAFKLSRENYNILKQLNDQKFSIYDLTKLLRATFNLVYSTINYGDEETNRKYAAQTGEQKHILSGEIPQIFVNLLRQINSGLKIPSVVFRNFPKQLHYFDQITKCYDKIFYSNDKQVTDCPGPHHCSVSTVNGLNCVIAKRTFIGQNLAPNIVLYTSPNKGKFHFSNVGCSL